MPSALFGAYTYYVTDNLQNQSASARQWTINGLATESSAGLNTGSEAALISSVPVPDGSTNYEIAATLNLTTSGGYYTLFLEASSNALLGDTTTGTFYAFDIENPTFNNGGCSATLEFYKVVNGSLTAIQQTTIPCGNGVTYHAVRTADGGVRFRVNGVEYVYFLDSQPIYGAGGVGGFSMPAGNSIALAQLGPLDTVAPRNMSTTMRHTA
jgi:hypothetical protein